jgi:Domain of unknown function (DUF1737)
MRYHICEAKSARALQEEVTRLLAKGWRPVGGISAANSSNSGIWWYYQAMVLRQDEAYALDECADVFASSEPELA